MAIIRIPLKYKGEYYMIEHDTSYFYIVKTKIYHERLLIYSGENYGEPREKDIIDIIENSRILKLEKLKYV